jgi:hypothetical protein
VSMVAPEKSACPEVKAQAHQSWSWWTHQEVLACILNITLLMFLADLTSDHILLLYSQGQSMCYRPWHMELKAAGDSCSVSACTAALHHFTYHVAVHQFQCDETVLFQLQHNGHGKHC